MVTVLCVCLASPFFFFIIANIPLVVLLYIRSVLAANLDGWPASRTAGYAGENRKPSGKVEQLVKERRKCSEI